MSALQSQAVVAWFMQKFGVTEEAAQGALAMFAKGEGQFPADLREFSPDAYAEYEAAFNAATSTPAAEMPAPVEEAPVAEEVAPPAEETV